MSGLLNDSVIEKRVISYFFSNNCSPTNKSFFPMRSKKYFAVFFVYLLFSIAKMPAQSAETPSFFELGTFADPARLVAFSPDSRKIVTTSPQYIAKIWDADSGKELHKLDTDVDRHKVNESSASWALPKSVAADFSPDGKRLVTASWDTAIRIWDVDSGKKLQTLEGHNEGVKSVVFSPDGKRIATASWDGTARIWEAESGKELQKLIHTDAEHGFNWVSSATFSPDGKKIVTHVHGDDHIVRVWDTNTGKQLQELKGHTNSPTSAVFLPDGKKIVTVSYDSTVRIWDADSGKELHKLVRHTTGFASRVSISQDGKKIATVAGAPDTAVRIWDVDTGKVLQTLREHEGSGNAMFSAALSPDGKKIVTTSDTGSGIVRIWDTNTGNKLQVLEGHQYSLFSATFSPDGKKIVVSSGDRHHGHIICSRVWILE